MNRFVLYLCVLWQSWVHTQSLTQNETIECVEKVTTPLELEIENTASTTMHSVATETSEELLAKLLPDMSDISFSRVGRKGDQTNSDATLYTAFDDFSWAITSRNLTSDAQQKRYNSFVQECSLLNHRCLHDDYQRMRMNKFQPGSVVNYTKEGFKKIRAPKQLYDILKDFWDKNRNRSYTELDEASVYHNSWQVPTSILLVSDDELEGGGMNLSARIWKEARDILEEWTGQVLSGSSVYGIRVYHNQSILVPHTDRMPLISSAIINVDQDVDEDWVLEVYGHDGRATNVTMKPGDMVLYESASVIHGRPWPLNGNYYANVFVHFEPIGQENSEEGLPDGGSLPPYVVKDSAWAHQFYSIFPGGWELLTNLEALAYRGDVKTLRHVAQRDSSALANSTRQCSLLLNAIQQKQIEVVDFLLLEMQYDINMVCWDNFTPFDAARVFFSEGEPTVAEIVARRGMTWELVSENLNEGFVAQRKEQCRAFTRAIEKQNAEALEFLLRDLLYDVNLICNALTPMDMADATKQIDQNGDLTNEIVEILLEYGGKTSYAVLAHLLHGDDD